MRYFIIFVFIFSLQNPVYYLPLQLLSVLTSHIPIAPKPQVTTTLEPVLFHE